MDSLLEIILEKDAIIDPKEFFKVSDQYKSSVTGKNSPTQEAITSN